MNEHQFWAEVRESNQGFSIYDQNENRDDMDVDPLDLEWMKHGKLLDGNRNPISPGYDDEEEKWG